MLMENEAMVDPFGEENKNRNYVVNWNWYYYII
jgi:hypothetical protein